MHDRFWIDVARIFSESWKAMPEYSIIENPVRYNKTIIKTLHFLEIAGYFKTISILKDTKNDDCIAKYILTDKGFLLMCRRIDGESIGDRLVRLFEEGNLILIMQEIKGFF